MTLEEIHGLTELMKQHPDYLRGETERYSLYIDGFTHAGYEDRLVPGELGPVSRELLLEETEYFVNTVTAHEENQARLENARSVLVDAESSRVIDGSRVTRESLSDSIEELLEEYTDALSTASAVMARVQKDERLPDPFTYKEPVSDDYLNAKPVKKDPVDMKGF